MYLKHPWSCQALRYSHFAFPSTPDLSKHSLHWPPPYRQFTPSSLSPGCRHLSWKLPAVLFSLLIRGMIGLPSLLLLSLSAGCSCRLLVLLSLMSDPELGVLLILPPPPSLLCPDSIRSLSCLSFLRGGRETNLQHMEVPGAGIESKPQLRPVPQL